MANTRAGRIVLHVQPMPDGAWEVREQRARRGFRCATKDEALAEARRIALEARLGQVRVHHPDGTAETEWVHDGESPPG